MQNIVVETVQIPETLAKKLSTLLVKQSIRHKLLFDSIEDQNKFEQMEELLIPIESEISKIKNDITKNYIPEEFKSDRFIWQFDGFNIDGNIVSIYKQW